MNPRTRRMRRHRRRARREALAEQALAAESVQVGLQYLRGRQQQHPLHDFDAAMRLAQRFARQAEAMQGKEAEWMRIAAISARKLGTPHPDLPGQDVGSHEILQQLIRRTERACARAGCRPLPGPVVGTLNENTINAFCSSFFGTTSLIVLHSSTLIFVLLLAKCILPAICARTPEGGLALGGRPDAAQLREAARRLAQLILAIKLEKDPRDAPSYMPPPGWIFHKLRYLVIESIELLLVAHEYGPSGGGITGEPPFEI